MDYPAIEMTEIERSLRLFCDARVTEIRAFDDRGATWSGYFDDWSKAAAAVQKLPQCKAVYFVLNGCKPELLARSANRIQRAGKGGTTGDQHVLRRHWLFIDADPCREQGISASDAEKEAARTVSRQVFAFLRQLGFGDPIVADSGNGWHLHYAIDIPADDDGLVKRCLESLAARFNTEAAKVDTAVFNPARICKLYGTPARKGDSTEDRPHRPSRLVHVPDTVTEVPIDLLRKLAGMSPAPESPRHLQQRRTGEPFDMATWIRDHGIQTEEPRPYSGDFGTGTVWELPVCPFNPEHAAGEAWIIQTEKGISAGCHHDSCQWWKWQDLRQRHEPGCYDLKPHEPPKQSKPSGNPATSPIRITTLRDATKQYLDMLEAGKADLVETGIPELDYAIGGGLAFGEMVIVAARPSHGKSAFGLQCLHHMTSRHMPCAMISEEMSALALGKRAIQYAIDTPEEYWRHEITAVSTGLDAHFAGASTCYVIENCGHAEVAADQIRKLAAEHGVQCVAIDYAQLLTSPGKSRYEQITNTSITLRQAANDSHTIVLVLCQLSREIEKRSKFVPVLSDLKESGQLEQDADVVFFLVWPHRLDSTTDPKEFQVWVGKNRNRARNQELVECRFAPSRQRITEVSAWEKAGRTEASNRSPRMLDF